ncbi:membrane protein [Mycolicibacterium cyprinidarum]|uniref:Membrane protein n=1 Tax=Mycolicibacterium cyprinidarum TaxID=2860311 RepID=A0ABQ4V389_9MYCO|nr:membrane protein [Mycolicibacterium sp. NGTWS0302]GJF08965.1 membrane protein [Mycolicibacterium sp. NGTWSNA01]GJF09824.1 membrane protein [Mycolicibacterium sp. NGTWS1803]
MSRDEEVNPVPDPPSDGDIARVLWAIEPLRKLINPKVWGIERVPQRGALLVGNHTVLGLLDAPLLCAELWDRGIMVRALGDHAHFKVPGWRDVATGIGVVDGTRAATAELMRRDEVIMVFPGGGREVAKRKDEKYKLIWKNRMGFARLAIEHGYPIVPFAAVGAEEAVDIVVDGESPLLAPVRALITNVLGSPDVPPVVRGIGLTPIPRPERQYYWFGEPIHTASVMKRHGEDRVVRDVREQTRAAIESGIEFLLEQRDADPHRSVVKRLLGPERR